MRRTVIAVATLGFVVLTAGGTALAAPPEIQQKSCEANGGTFDRDRGVKTCTTTTQTQQTTPYVGIATGPILPGQGFAFVLTGRSSRTDVFSVTTAQTQKGNGDVTTTQNATVISSTVTPISCTLDIAGIEQTVDDSVCADAGLFPPPTPLGPVA